MILILDNRDSFTFNLAQALQGLGVTVRVERSTELSPLDVAQMSPAGVLVGPGPGQPAAAGCSEAVILSAARGETHFPIFGVCLGHQAMATALGGRLRAASTLVHGETRGVEHDGKGLFEGLASPMEIARYNSLAIDEGTLPGELHVTGRTPDGDIAAIEHRVAPLFGVQGHPESILCLADGLGLFKRFLALAEGLGPARPRP